MDRLAIYKALGDPTRFHLFDLLVASSEPMATSELAIELRLHPNTVRPHLERLREVGLLDVAADKRGAVGRPQHRWEISPDAPDLGDLSPEDDDATEHRQPPEELFASSGPPLLAALLAALATEVGVTPQDVLNVGRQRGRALAERVGQNLNSRGGEVPWESCMARCEAGVVELCELGDFEPEVVSSSRSEATVRFSASPCPFGEIVEVYPELTCQLHRGMVEGLSAGLGGGRVSSFNDVNHPTAPCQVSLITT